MSGVRRDNKLRHQGDRSAPQMRPLPSGPGDDNTTERHRPPNGLQTDKLRAKAGRLVLVTATKDLQHSEAAVLQVLLRTK